MPTLNAENNLGWFGRLFDGINTLIEAVEESLVGLEEIEETKNKYKNCIHELDALNARELYGKKLLNYLEEKYEYRVLTEPATWGGLAQHGSYLEGLLGEHAMVILPDHRAIEYSLPDLGENNRKDPLTLHISQEEIRTATGATLEKMWQNHIQLKQTEFYSPLAYRPFKHDCFTFVDRTLELSGEPLSTLKRAPQNETQLVEIVENLHDIRGTYTRLSNLFAEKSVTSAGSEPQEESAAAHLPLFRPKSFSAQAARAAASEFPIEDAAVVRQILDKMHLSM